MTAQVVA